MVREHTLYTCKWQAVGITDLMRQLEAAEAARGRVMTTKGRDFEVLMCGGGGRMHTWLVCKTSLTKLNRPQSRTLSTSTSCLLN